MSIPRKLATQPDSLFVLSLPRSLSTQIYHEARTALGLQEPIWTTDGEILNSDRFVLSLDTPSEKCWKYMPEHDDAVVARMAAFLNQAVQPGGFAYKDVVQPFIISSWLSGRRFPVLKVRRCLPDVAYAMIGRRWIYPAHVFPQRDLLHSLLLGLAHAWRAIDQVPGVTVDFDEVIDRREALVAALASLYPGMDLQLPSSHDDRSFELTREAVLRRRETPFYRELEQVAHEALREGCMSPRAATPGLGSAPGGCVRAPSPTPARDSSGTPDSLPA